MTPEAVAMDPAQMVLLGGGLFNIVYGFLSGFAFAAARKEAEFAPRYLVSLHVGTLMQGSMLMALSLIVPVASMDASNKELAARLMVFSSLCIALKDTANWLQGVKDEYGEKRVFSQALGAAGAIGGTVGLAMLSSGFVRAYLA